MTYAFHCIAWGVLNLLAVGGISTQFRMGGWVCLSHGWCSINEHIRVVDLALDPISQALVMHGAAVAWALGHVRRTWHTGVVSYLFTSFFIRPRQGEKSPSTILFWQRWIGGERKLCPQTRVVKRLLPMLWNSSDRLSISSVSRKCYS